METITLYQRSDEILNGSKIILHFFPCRLLPPNPPHLIMLSASSSSFSKQSSHIGIGTKIINKELEPPVSESSIKISKFHAPTDSEHKFHKTRTENWPPLEFKLEFPWLRIHRHNHRLGTWWVRAPLLGIRSSTPEIMQVFPNPTSITQSGISLQ